MGEHRDSAGDGFSILVRVGLQADRGTLAAVEDWQRSWIRQWEAVRRLEMEDELLPAPLFCWPP